MNTDRNAWELGAEEMAKTLDRRAAQIFDDLARSELLGAEMLRPMDEPSDWGMQVEGAQMKRQHAIENHVTGLVLKIVRGARENDGSYSRDTLRALLDRSLDLIEVHASGDYDPALLNREIALAKLKGLYLMFSAGVVEVSDNNLSAIRSELCTLAASSPDNVHVIAHAAAAECAAILAGERLRNEGGELIRAEVVEGAFAEVTRRFVAAMDDYEIRNSDFVVVGHFVEMLTHASVLGLRSLAAAA